MSRMAGNRPPWCISSINDSASARLRATLEAASERLTAHDWGGLRDRKPTLFGALPLPLSAVPLFRDVAAMSNLTAMRILPIITLLVMEVYVQPVQRFTSRLGISLVAGVMDAGGHDVVVRYVGGKQTHSS